MALTFDPRALLAITAVLGIVFTVLLHVMARNLPRRILGIKEWRNASLLWVAGTSLLITRGVIPELFSAMLANLAITSSHVMVAMALARLSNRHQVPRMATGTAAVSLSAYALLWSLGSDYQIAALPIYFGNGFLLALMGYLSTRIETKSAASVVLGMVFTALAVVVFLRGATVLIGELSHTPLTHWIPHSLYDPSWLQRIYVASYPIGYVFGTLCFLLHTLHSVQKYADHETARLEDAVKARTHSLESILRENRLLQREIMQVVDQERTAVGAELHDDLGQRLLGISMQARLLLLSSAAMEPAARGVVENLEKNVIDAMNRVREIAHDLAPVGEIEGRSSLGCSLRNLCDNQNHFGIPVVFAAQDAIPQVGQNTATHLYRIAQECLQNACRHGKAKTIAVNLSPSGQGIRLEIVDDGEGFDIGNVDRFRSRGLHIMQYRCALIGYEMAIRTEARKGTAVIVQPSG